jgi:hypothetical protein
MIKMRVAALAALLSFAIMPQMLVIDAYAKRLPLPNNDYTFAQYSVMIMPAIVAVAVLFMIAFYTRQDQALAVK